MRRIDAKTKKENRKDLKKISVALIMCMLALSSYPLSVQAGPNTTSDSREVVPPSSPIKVDLEVSQLIGLGIRIACKISSLDFYGPDTSAEITLSDGFSLVNGALSWKGNLARNGLAEMVATANAVRQGMWTIIAKVRCILPNGDWVGDVDHAYVSVSERSISSISRTPAIQSESNCSRLLDPPSIARTVKDVSTKPKAVAADSHSTPVLKERSLVEPRSPGELTVTGRFWYWDNNEVVQPLAWATVWIYDSEWYGGLVYLGEALTDLNGYFTFGPINNDDGWLEDGLDIICCVASWTSAAKVIDAGGNVYDGWTDVFGGCPDGVLNIGDWIIPQAERGAWMIFSYNCGMTAGWNYLANGGAGYTMSEVTCRWPTETWPHYHLGGEIHLPDYDAARSPDVVQHEYAHAVMYTVYGGHWPPGGGGQHWINLHSNVGMAWTEGWAEFFPMAVQNDPWFTYINQYSIDLEAPTWGTPGWDNGDDVEGRVCGGLWDIFDATNDGFDAYSDGFLHIWDVVHAQTDDSFADFWAAWRTRGHNIPYATYAIYQNTIVYFGALDHVTVSPSSADVQKGSTAAFTAQGYDANNIPVVGITYTWSVTGGIGYVSPTSTPDTGGPGQSTTFYATTVGSGSVSATATYVNTRTGSASVYVYSGGGGGCPFVFVWNGEYYTIDNNLLPASEMSRGADVQDYYKLEQTTVPIWQGGRLSLYSLQIHEFENEHDYFDQVKFFAVDHPAGTNIAVTQNGEILTYKQPFSPQSCVDDDGRNRLPETCKMDGDVLDPTTYFEGYPGDYLVLNFGRVDSRNAKLILRTDMKKMFECIDVQVKGESGAWQTVETLVPRTYWSIDAVNLSPYISKGRDLWVRLYWKYHHRLDYVGLDTTAQEKFEIRRAILVSAIHTTEGHVESELLRADQIYAELLPGQQMHLTFLMPSSQGGETTFVLYAQGHYDRLE